ncbi:rod shape-determining protein [Fusibacter bizertensis]|jgi:rod shape-determining protein MreB|uniref:Cell shape-determining protein MreB n=2 Tax=Fusibacter bizertensis TaxID=1488331 RepID=A0ABT6NDT8_9FIRM|nr:rod shape-determining protein [Fusibacter bizertensis]
MEGGTRMGIFGVGAEIGIDLGTASVLVYIKGKGIVLREPSVVAIDKNTDRVLAVGNEARKMLGRTPGNIIAIRPLKDGVISDYDVTERMLRYFINKTCGKRRLFKPKIIICVPSGVTEVEKRAVLDATMEAGGGKTFLIEEPIAAAIGAGLDITKPDGNMVIDIGGGTSDIAVISLGGIVVSASIKVAGDKFDESIIKYMRKKHNLLIGERTAEELKINVGTAYPRTKAIKMDCRGRDLITGLPKNISISSEEMLEALQEVVNAVADAVHSVLEKTPPELASDISSRGIVMTGGGSLLHGLNKLIEKRTGIPTYIADDAVSCVAKGTGMSLEHLDILEKNMMTSARKKYL